MAESFIFLLEALRMENTDWAELSNEMPDKILFALSYDKSKGESIIQLQKNVLLEILSINNDAKAQVKALEINGRNLSESRMPDYSKIKEISQKLRSIDSGNAIADLLDGVVYYRGGIKFIPGTDEGAPGYSRMKAIEAFKKYLSSELGKKDKKAKILFSEILAEKHNEVYRGNRKGEILIKGTDPEASKYYSELSDFFLDRYAELMAEENEANALDELYDALKYIKMAIDSDPRNGTLLIKMAKIQSKLKQEQNVLNIAEQLIEIYEKK